jgi:hypothetical protein
MASYLLLGYRCPFGRKMDDCLPSILRANSSSFDGSAPVLLSPCFSSAVEIAFILLLLVLFDSHIAVVGAV